MTSLGNNTDGLEVGMVVAWTLSSNPSDSYLECNGQAIDGSKYPKLYALMHNVPDYRGMFLRGLGGNSDNLGVLQGDAIRNITGEINMEVQDISYKYATEAFFIGENIAVGDGQKGAFGEMYRAGFDASRVVPVANENRPINKAVRYFIKAK